MKKAVAFFDFDGTITSKDTMLEFIRFNKGWINFFIGFLLYTPYILAYQLKLFERQKAKEKILGFFFKGMDSKKFEEACQAFTEKKLSSLIRPGALKEILKLKKEGVEVIIVSASPDSWIKNWAISNGVSLIASQLEIQNGKLTGRLNGKNCHGEEKVRRILESYDIKQFDVIYAYGDTGGDLPMLKLATNPSYKPFR